MKTYIFIYFVLVYFNQGIVVCCQGSDELILNFSSTESSDESCQSSESFNIYVDSLESDTNLYMSETLRSDTDQRKKNEKVQNWLDDINKKKRLEIDLFLKSLLEEAKKKVFEQNTNQLNRLQQQQSIQNQEKLHKENQEKRVVRQEEIWERKKIYLAQKFDLEKLMFEFQAKKSQKTVNDFF